MLFSLGMLSRGQLRLNIACSVLLVEHLVYRILSVRETITIEVFSWLQVP